MSRLVLAILAMFVVCGGGFAPAFGAPSLAEEMRQTIKRVGGCTRVRHKFKRLRKQYPAYHFAFAGRKAATITGIQGCGYSWDKNKAKADSRAMESYRRIEKRYGTGDGTKTCRLLD